jgi:ribosomal protein S27AE
MNDKAKIRDAMDAIIEGRKPPGDVHIHLTKTTTKADWDALDPNSYETECAKCGAYVVGQFGPNHETNTPCGKCGSTEYAGGIGSPAGAFSLAMHDPAFD